MSTTQESSTSETYAKSSPWPLLIAIGIALSELGVLLGLRPVSVGGLLLLVGTITGLLRESNYVTGLHWSLGVMGGLLIASGIGLIMSEQMGTTVRGESVLIAGSISLLGALTWAGAVRFGDFSTGAEEVENKSTDTMEDDR